MNPSWLIGKKASHEPVDIIIAVLIGATAVFDDEKASDRCAL
jgi:hypothetical protein